MNKNMQGSGLFVNIVILMALIAVAYFFGFRPYKVTGGDVGKYKTGQTVLAVSKFLVLNPLRKGDVIVFDISKDVSSVSEIISAPGDALEEPVDYVSGETFTDKHVPPDFVVVRFNAKTWLIPDSQIKGLVWYGF